MQLRYQNDPKEQHPDVISGKRAPTMEETFRKAFIHYRGVAEFAKDGEVFTITIPLEGNFGEDELCIVPCQIEVTVEPQDYSPLLKMLDRIFKSQ